ncbi:MAG TPA: hypothetical protein ENF76_03000 [Candidatus Bathyarchaeota archaeon]|nr:hypothetical protein [Candidatus Bathyarchaeota archaeon]
MSLRKIPTEMILLFISLAAVLGISALSLLMANQTIPNTGNVETVGVGVYWESTCENNVTSIDWGYLEPGETKNVTVYIQNSGSVPVILTMDTDNWQPSTASTYISVNWNRQNYVLTPGSVVETLISIHVSESITDITSFSFDLIITGTEQT